MLDPTNKVYRVRKGLGWTKGAELTPSGQHEAERRHEDEPEPDTGGYQFAAPGPINDCGLM